MTKVGRLPCDECGGKCCTFAPMTQREFKTIRKNFGVPLGAIKVAVGHGVMVTMPGTDGKCAYLVGGKCSVWVDRPKVCRLYGEVKEMPCQYLYPDAAKAEAERMVKRCPWAAIRELER